MGHQPARTNGSPSESSRPNESTEHAVIAANPDKVADAKTNPKAIGWFADLASMFPSTRAKRSSR